MALSISKQQLLELLQKAYPIIPLKSSLQILSNFRITVSKGIITVTATDLDQSIRIVSEIKGDDTFDITINARKIFEIIKEFPEGTVSLSVEDKVLILESEKNFNCKIAGADATDFPNLPDISGGFEFKINITGAFIIMDNIHIEDNFRFFIEGIFISLTFLNSGRVIFFVALSS